MLRKIFCSWLIGFSLAGYTSESASNTCPEIKVAGGDWLKYEYIERYKGSATGKGIEILKAFDEAIDVDIKIMEGVPFARQLKELKEGQLDLMIGLYYIQSRRDDFVLSKPYYKEKLYVYAIDGKFSSEVKLSDLHHLVGGIRRGSSYGDRLDQFFELRASHMVTVKDSNNVAQLLLKGRIDYFVGSPTVTEEFEAISDKIKRYNSIGSQDTSFAFSKNSPCKIWLKRLNTIIAESAKP